MYYNEINRIREIQNKNIINIEVSFRNCPEFIIPEYIILINNKVNFLKIVAEKNIFSSNIFQWIDF